MSVEHDEMLLGLNAEISKLRAAWSLVRWQSGPLGRRRRETGCVDQLLSWYARERVLLGSLEILHLHLQSFPKDNLPLYLQGVYGLLIQCANMLEELTLSVVQMSKIDQVSEICRSIFSLCEIDILMTLVTLPLFPKLRKISWSNRPYVFEENQNLYQYVARQLSSVEAPCKISEVVLAIDLEEYNQSTQDDMRRIDRVLVGDRFPGLQRVQVFPTVPLDCFSSLRAGGILVSGDYW